MILVVHFALVADKLEFLDFEVVDEEGEVVSVVEFLPLISQLDVIVLVHHVIQTAVLDEVVVETVQVCYLYSLTEQQFLEIGINRNVLLGISVIQFEELRLARLLVLLHLIFYECVVLPPHCQVMLAELQRFRPWLDLSSEYLLVETVTPSTRRVVVLLALLASLQVSHRLAALVALP